MEEGRDRPPLPNALCLHSPRKGTYLMCQCALLSLTYTIKLIDNAEKEINVSKNYCNYVKRNKISFDYKC